MAFEAANLIFFLAFTQLTTMLINLSHKKNPALVSI